MPMLVRPQWLHKAGPFFRRAEPPPIEAAGLLQHAVDTGWTDRYHIVVQHHESQAAIAMEWMPVVVVDDGLFFPFLQPPIPGHFAVVLVSLAVAIFPLIKLARAELHPDEQPIGRQFGALRPVFDVIDDFVADIVGNPNSL